MPTIVRFHNILYLANLWVELGTCLSLVSGTLCCYNTLTLLLQELTGGAPGPGLLSAISKPGRVFRWNGCSLLHLKTLSRSAEGLLRIALLEALPLPNASASFSNMGVLRNPRAVAKGSCSVIWCSPVHRNVSRHGMLTTWIQLCPPFRQRLRLCGGFVVCPASAALGFVWRIAHRVSGDIGTQVPSSLPDACPVVATPG